MLYLEQRITTYEGNRPRSSHAAQCKHFGNFAAIIHTSEC
jgi:hypothetical protein